LGEGVGRYGARYWTGESTDGPRGNENGVHVKRGGLKVKKRGWRTLPGVIHGCKKKGGGWGINPKRKKSLFSYPKKGVCLRSKSGPKRIKKGK